MINFHGLFRNALRCRKIGACRILVPLRYSLKHKAFSDFLVSYDRWDFQPYIYLWKFPKKVSVFNWQTIQKCQLFEYYAMALTLCSTNIKLPQPIEYDMILSKNKQTKICIIHTLPEWECLIQCKQINSFLSLVLKTFRDIDWSSCLLGLAVDAPVDQPGLQGRLLLQTVALWESLAEVGVERQVGPALQALAQELVMWQLMGSGAPPPPQTTHGLDRWAGVSLWKNIGAPVNNSSKCQFYGVLMDGRKWNAFKKKYRHYLTTCMQ